MPCVCEWPDTCDGTGTLYCECGGTCAVCSPACDSEMPCPGCEECDHNLAEYLDEEDD